MVAVGDKIMELVMCDLLKVSVESSYKVEQDYLELQKTSLEEKRKLLLDEVAEKLGELAFYCTKLEEVDDRIFSIKIGEAQKLDSTNEETKQYREQLIKVFLEKLNVLGRHGRGGVDGKEKQGKMDA